MCLVSKDDVSYLRYLICLIESPVYIIYQYKLKQFSDIKMVFVYKVSVDKDASGSRVDQGLYRKGLGGISDLRSDRKIERSSADIENTNSKIQRKYFFIEDNKQQARRLKESESQMHLLGHCQVTEESPQNCRIYFRKPKLILTTILKIELISRKSKRTEWDF